jgi:hypothetical protein
MNFAGYDIAGFEALIVVKRAQSFFRHFPRNAGLLQSLMRCGFVRGQANKRPALRHDPASGVARGDKENFDRALGPPPGQCRVLNIRYLRGSSTHGKPPSIMPLASSNEVRQPIKCRPHEGCRRHCNDPGYNNLLRHVPAHGRSAPRSTYAHNGACNRVGGGHRNLPASQRRIPGARLPTPAPPLRSSRRAFAP